jgi:hypothetical protein
MHIGGVIRMGIRLRSADVVCRVSALFALIGILFLIGCHSSTTADGYGGYYSVGGTISGLTGSGLVLQDNGDDNLLVSAGATYFTFATDVPNFDTYAVTVLTQPSNPAQNCAVTGGSGTESANIANVTTVQVTCTTIPISTIGGTISGLTGSGLVLQDNGDDNLLVNASATSFTFATAIASGSTYNVTVLTQPSSPAELCGVTNGSGTVSAKVTNVVVTCTADPPTVDVVPGAPPVQAGTTTNTFTITVANDQSGDLPTVTSFTLGGVACTPATCGSFGAVTGTAGSGNYTMVYTPPPTLTAKVAPTVTVTPSLGGPFFAGTTSFTVNPAGVVVAASGLIDVLQVGSAARTLTFTTYNDIVNAGVGEGVTITLTASGYACSSLSPNSCGNLGTPVVSTSGTTTTTTVTYTPPTAVPAEPYDRPRIQATSVADPAIFTNSTFLLSTTAQPTPLSIPFAQKVDSALTGGAAITVSADFTDTTAAKSASWTLTANGAACAAPTCGTLGSPTVTTNGNSVTSTVTYTPPVSVPTESSPTITATMTANSAATDNFSFNVVNGACGAGNNAVLNGNYAFLLRGGGATVGYDAIIGSFTADGNGDITGGLEDINRSTGPITGLSIESTGSSYSVGPDNRGCLTLVNSNGNTATYRIALGTISGTTATQGSMITFNDTTGQGIRSEGVLKQQNLTGQTSSTLSGTYAFGREGVDSSGGRYASAGLITSNGAGTLSNISLDYDDAGSIGTLAGGSGSYSLATNAPNGRGTAQTTITSVSGMVTNNFVTYVVSSSETLAMSADTLGPNTPIQSGDMKLQTGPFSTSGLTSGSGYVFYAFGFDHSNGGSVTTLGQSEFTTNTGNATLTTDENDDGISQTEAIGPAVFTVASSGRMTGTGAGLGSNPPIIYLVDSTQGFIVGTDGIVSFGYIQEQTLSSFSTSTITGAFFFGGSAPTTGSSHDSGTVNFSPGIPTGTITGTDDASGPNYTLGCVQNCGGGLEPNSSISRTYTFSTAPTAPGQGKVGNQTLAYIISASKVVSMQMGTSTNTNPAEVFIVQQ